MNTALLGTGKAEGGEDLLAALPGLAGMQTAPAAGDSDAETQMLDRTALLYVFRRCGAKPLAESIRSTTAAPELKPYCSDYATRVLREILEGGSLGLLQLWLSRCEANSNIVPPPLLDDLLQYIRPHRLLRPLILSCTGKRGEWLCGLNPEWNYRTEGSDTERWETGYPAERAEILQQVRNADPAAARSMLEQVWSREKADVKETLLQAIEHGLSGDDLPFLEGLINEKSKRVQAAVYELLLQLPGSSIVRAFEETLRGAIKLQTTRKLLGMVSKTSLEISFPKELDKQLAEAIGRKQSGAPISEDEFRLLRMITSVPPQFWEEHLEVPPQRVLELFEAVSENGYYRDALQQAVVRFKVGKWAALFVRNSGQLHPQLIALLSPADKKEYLAAGAKAAPASVIDYYVTEEIVWDAALSPALMAYAAGNPYRYNKSFYYDYIHLMPVSLLPQLDSFAPVIDASTQNQSPSHIAEAWQKAQETVRALLELKQRINNAWA